MLRKMESADPEIQNKQQKHWKIDEDWDQTC